MKMIVAFHTLTRQSKKGYIPRAPNKHTVISVPLRLAPLPSYQCYECVGCGNCCRGIFFISVNAEERERILAQGWEREPDLQGIQLFTPTGKGQFLLAHRNDGACVFLDERGLCRIHAKFGEVTKPLACRVYPFRLIPVGEKVHTDLRWDCPAAPANQGRPLSEYRDSLREYIPLLLPPEAAERPAPPLFGHTQLSWEKLERINATIIRLAGNTAYDLTTRMAACVNVSAALRFPGIVTLDESQLTHLLEALYEKIVALMADDPLERVRPLALESLLLRQVAGIYGREDRRGERGVAWRRLRAMLRMLAGEGLLPPLRADFPTVPFSALEEPLGFPPDAVVEPLARYMRCRLESMGFFGGGYFGYSYLDGLNMLLLTYPLTFWFARAYAAGQGLPAPNRACIERGIQLVNHYHGMLPVFNMPQERLRFRFLCERTALRRLILWYGR